MNMNMLKKGDFLIIGIVMVAVVFSFVYISHYRKADNGAHKVAIIKVKDKVVKSIDLDTVTEPQRIEISGEYNQVVLVENGRIRFVEAECPDKVCVNTGWLSDKGDMAVCIPNSAMIKIEGQSQKVDAVTH